VSHGYFGQQKTSLDRLGEHNLQKSRVRNGEFVYNGSYKEKVSKVQRSIQTKKNSISHFNGSQRERSSMDREEILKVSTFTSN
jgi:hypothetical protein